MSEKYGISQPEVPRFSTIDMQIVLNENRTLKMEVPLIAMQVDAEAARILEK